MFFFFFNNKYDGYVTENSDNLVDRLQRITEARGIRNVDLAEMTGWPTSKVSKILQHKQKLSLDDFRTWCMVLGYTPNVIINDEDLRDYDISEHAAPLSDCIRDLVDVADEGKAEDVIDKEEYDFRDEDDTGHKDTSENIADIIVRFEFPMSIVSHLNLEPSDFIIRGEVHDEEPDVNIDPERVVSYRVGLKARNVPADGDYVPAFRCIIDPYCKKMVWGVFFYSKKNHAPLTEAKRSEYKNLTLTNDRDTASFDNLVESGEMHLKEMDKFGEVFSYIYDISKLPPEERLIQDLQAIYAQYSNLVYEACGVDIQGIRGRLSTVELFNALSGSSLFSQEIEENVRKSRGYKCEIDGEHESFETDAGVPYMEVVPLIPFRYAPLGEGIKSEANAVCLCPMCAARFRHGKKADQEDMIIKLWRKHEKALQNWGFNISLSSVLQWNGL